MVQPPSAKVLIVVPVFNHAATLGGVLQDLLRLNQPVLVVNDGSEDDIETVLAGFPDLPHLHHRVNQGKGAALVTAMRYAEARGYQAVLSFDADGQHLAADVPRLIAAWTADPESLIIGARDFDGPNSGDVTGASRFGRRFSNFWIWVETGHRLPDTQTGLRVYPIDSGILDVIQGRRYSFEIEIITRSLWRGRPVRSIPVQVYYPPRAERVSHFKPWMDNVRLSGTHTRLCTLQILKGLGLYRPQPKKEVRGARGAALFIAKMGTPLAYACLIFPVLSSFLWRHFERGCMLTFYHKLHPEWSQRRKLWGAFRNFWYFGASIVDRLALRDQRLVPASVDHNSQVQGLFPPPGSILVGAHYGDWFLIAKQAARLRNEILGIVVNAGATPEFFSALEKRFAGSLRILSAQQDLLGFALSVKEILDDGGRVCFLIDRVTGPGLVTPFLNAEAIVAQTPFAMAARLRVPLHFVCACKDGPGASAPYQIFAQEIWNGSGKVHEQDLATQTMQILEQRVRDAPQHWFNFIPFWREAPPS